MREEYLTMRQVFDRYDVIENKFRTFYNNRSQNGLYKAVYRKRTRVFFRRDYLEKWLKENDLL